MVHKTLIFGCVVVVFVVVDVVTLWETIVNIKQMIKNTLPGNVRILKYIFKLNGFNSQTEIQQKYRHITVLS